MYKSLGYDRSKAYTTSGHRVDNLTKSHHGGWQGEINGILIKWTFDFIISEIDSYNPVAQRRLKKGELDIARLPAGFDYIPHFNTSEQMSIALLKRNNVLVKNNHDH